MIPLRDINRSETFPLVNYLIIIANVLLFFMELAQGPALQRFIFTYGLVPARYSVPEISRHFSPFQQIAPFFTSMFLHGGFLHLILNMWFLFIFGDNVEDRLGHLRYLLFYVLCGLGSALAHLVINWHSTVPTIGASGAISGVMGAYFVLYPRARILALIPFFFFFQLMEIPAFYFLGFWFLIQFMSAALSGGTGGGVAWWAHIGGFVFGIVFLVPFLLIPHRRKKRIRRWSRSPWVP